MNNKKGLSAIVATLIIILLAIVAVGIVWTIIQNTISQTGESIELNQKCLAVDLHAKISKGSEDYSVTISRKDPGETIKGYKLIFESEDKSSSKSISQELSSLEKKTIKVSLEEDFEPTQVKVVPYFFDKSSEEYLCTPGKTFKIQ